MAKNTRDTILILIALAMFTIISSFVLQEVTSRVEYPNALEHEDIILLEDGVKMTIDYYEVFNPDMNQPIYRIDQHKDPVVREYNIKINKEMGVMTQFIKRHNNRVPLLVADFISNSIIKNCEIYNVPSELILGIVEVESFYDPYAIGPPVGGNQRRRARGLGQILDEKCGKEKIIKDKLHNIEYNIVCTIKIIKSKLAFTKGDLDKSLYYYVGKDETYAVKVFKTMGEYTYFRSQRL